MALNTAQVESQGFLLLWDTKDCKSSGRTYRDVWECDKCLLWMYAIRENMYTLYMHFQVGAWKDLIYPVFWVRQNDVPLLSIMA